MKPKRMKGISLRMIIIMTVGVMVTAAVMSVISDGISGAYTSGLQNALN